MGIRQKGNLSELKARMAAAKKRVDLAIYLRLSKLGEELVNHARSIPAEVGYTDRTGNLRSSTGYIIVKDGQVMKSNFKKVSAKNIALAKQGTAVGLDHALTVASELQDGYALIVVAGMDYALAIESRGRDVLTGTEFLGKKKIPIEISKLKESIKNMKI